MKIQQENIDQIKNAFGKMQSKEDLLSLLNQAKPLIYGDKTIPFTLKQLTYYVNPKLGNKHYREFKIKKKSGAERNIHAPVRGLKAIQRTLSFVLQCIFEPHQAAMGFVRNRSIVDNARIHVGNNYVYNLDLKDFFPSIDQARVWKCLQLKPFNLNDNHPLLGFKSKENPDASFWILANNATDKDINDVIWRITYDGYRFFEGNFALKLKDGGSILYKVNKNNGKEHEGKITVFIDKSQFEEVRSVAITEAKKTQLDPLWVLKYIVWKLILSDQQKHYEQNKRSKLANYLAALCCTEIEVERKNPEGEWVRIMRNVLPQGAPTSPVITNIVCQRLDFLLSGVAKRFGLKYSRYADDITFSSMHNVYQTDSDFLKELHRIITEQGFYIKESKTRLQRNGYRKEVTGLLVNEKANVQKRYIKQLRMWLYYWERYGYDRAFSFFLQQYLSDKGNIVKGKPNMENVIQGKLEYLKMIKGDETDLYQKLNSRFKSLCSTRTKANSNLEEIISTEVEKDKQVKITLEVYQSPELKEKLNNSINIPKNTTLPNTFIVENTGKESEEEIHDDVKTSWLFPHNPIYTVSFLKKFKVGDGSGFKELVHDIILSDETVEDILNKVKSHPNFIKHYKNEKIVNVSYLNRGIVLSVRQLIGLFENEGIPYYKNSHKHPFNNDSTYTNYAKQFKKKYRYGSGSEYSKLQFDFISIFNDLRVPVSSLSFLPDERKFNIRSSFFTWQPSIYNGIRYIVQGVLDHSNIDGLRPYNPADKSISVEVENIQSEPTSFVELRIFDCKSIAKINSSTLLQFLKGSSPYKFDFRNLCDWIVECDFLDESSKRLNLLIAPEYALSIQEIEDLPLKVGGFKHILRFYDVR